MADVSYSKYITYTTIDGKDKFKCSICNPNPHYWLLMRNYNRHINCNTHLKNITKAEGKVQKKEKKTKEKKTKEKTQEENNQNTNTKELLFKYTNMCSDVISLIDSYARNTYSTFEVGKTYNGYKVVKKTEKNIILEGGIRCRLSRYPSQEEDDDVNNPDWK
jgi:hypothetical protein